MVTDFFCCVFITPLARRQLIKNNNRGVWRSAVDQLRDRRCDNQCDDIDFYCEGAEFSVQLLIFADVDNMHHVNFEKVLICLHGRNEPPLTLVLTPARLAVSLKWFDHRHRSGAPRKSKQRQIGRENLIPMR